MPIERVVEYLSASDKNSIASFLEQIDSFGNSINLNTVFHLGTEFQSLGQILDRVDPENRDHHLVHFFLKDADFANVLYSLALNLNHEAENFLENLVEWETDSTFENDMFE